MKQYIILLLVGAGFFMSYNMEAQITPEFTFTLHVEDAAGNQDSVVLGYDHSFITLDTTINTQIGEIRSDTNYDSIFEVKIHKFFLPGASISAGAGLPYAKKLIAGYDGNCTQPYIIQTYPIFISVYSTHFPLTFRWQQSAFSLPCNKGTLLFSTWKWLDYPNMYDFMPTFLSNSDSFVENFTTLPLYSYDKAIVYLNNGQQDSVSIFNITFANDRNNIGITNMQTNNIQVFPNPATDYLEIASKEQEIKEASLSNMLGQELPLQLEGSYPTRVDISELPPGIYSLRVHGQYVQKIEKW